MKYKWKIIKNKKKYKNLDTYHPIIHKLLSNINIKQKDVNSFLKPETIDIPNPNLISDVNKAAEEILKYSNSKDSVFIHGDYDADGIVATNILWDFLYRNLIINCTPIIPNRFADGYGLSENTLDEITSKGGKLVITVDCGIKDIDLIKKYKNLRFIITDHHALPVDEEGKPFIPYAPNLIAVIHPLHPKFNYPSKEICGANVAWKLICVLNSKLKNKFDVQKYQSLVALATITDIMPLIGENRIIVKKGVEDMKNSSNIGLNSLFKTINLDKKLVQTYHLGYVIGPNFNAAGRIDDALDAVRLLSTNDENKASSLATKLNQLNQKRQGLTEELLEEALGKVEHDSKLISVYGENWPEGIIGLIAGKLCEKFHKPVIVMNIDKEKKSIKGSARSISKFNITQALARVSEYLERYGGHKQAAGFSVKFDQFDEFLKNLHKFVDDSLNPNDLIPELDIIDTLDSENINKNLINTIELFEPFGNSNPKPKFLIKNFEVVERKIIGNGDKHYKLIVNKDRINITAIAFNKKDLIEKINPGDIIDIVGCPNINKWNGNEYVQFEIIDLKKIK